MPLVRVSVRNEFGVGDPFLYKAANKDDSKGILEGVAVSGLVGILRQLGDLAEFAAEVFDDLHEQVKATAARGHKMMIRVQRIEAELPPLEKFLMEQRSHIHFAYTEGSDWHPSSQTKQIHLTHNNSPQCIMESYKECRHPPRLFLLDKFDTSGTGACLKRYSDPSFFKMACRLSELMKLESEQRGSNAHKSKKKGRQHRNGKVQLVMSTSQRRRRIQFASSDTEGQSSADVTSTSDTCSKPEPSDQHTSFDSTPCSNCNECILDVNSLRGSEEPVHKELPALKMKMQSNKKRAPVVHRKWQRECTENDSPLGFLQDQSVNGSPSVSWDEKTELSKYSYQQNEDATKDQDQVIKPMTVSGRPYKLEQKNADLGNADNIPEYFPGEKQFDEIAGETHNHMDALNTIESEVETDSECQTKWEVELKSNIKDQETASITSGKHNTFQSSDSPNGHPVSLSPYSTLNKEVPPDISYSDAAKSSFHEQPPHIGMPSSIDFNCSKGSDHHDMSWEIGFESCNSNPSSGSSISNLQGNEVTVGLCNSVGSENSNVSSIKSWLSGRLLGVEPSKSPDVTVSAVIHKKSSDATNNVGDGSVRKVPIQDINEYSSCVKERDGSPDIVVPANLHLLSSDQLVGRTGNTGQPLHHIEDSVSGYDQQDSNMFKNRRQTSTESKIYHALASREQLELGSSEYPIPSISGYTYPSPPLEHMKISFRPLNCSPDGHQGHGSIQDDTIPAFRLIPDHAITFQDVASESDDDTFYRSSPYPSDDLRSLPSESNSELWESGELNGSKHFRIFNALHRTSSTTSTSSSFEHDEAHSKIHPSHEFGNLNAQDDTKSFDSNISKDIQHSIVVAPIMSQQEEEVDFGPGGVQDPALQHLDELPPPPPLPPLQWRITKPAHNLFEDKQYAIRKDETHPNVGASTTPLPPKPPAPNQPHVEGSCSGKIKKDHKQWIGFRQSNQAAKGKLQDEREDFLQQIRIKSFNLRRTVTRTPSFMPAPATNNNVVAILEKANAIRKAFASSDDDSDDESWSDN